jgi:hypothetical protein
MGRFLRSDHSHDTIYLWILLTKPGFVEPIKLLPKSPNSGPMPYFCLEILTICEMISTFSPSHHIISGPSAVVRSQQHLFRSFLAAIFGAEMHLPKRSHEKDPEQQMYRLEPQSVAM